MASQFPPKKNTAFTLYFTLYKNDGTVIANPGTITKKVSIDGAAVADIAAAVTEEDTTYGQLSVVLSTSEMNGDGIWVYIKDDTTGCVPFTCTIYTAGSLVDDISAELAKVPKSDGSLTLNATCSSDIKSGLSTQAELNKVPKSDGTTSWNATALASINAEVDTALNTAIPGSPTADSINERIVAIDAYGAPPSAATIKTAIEAAGSSLAQILEDTGTTLDTLVRDIPTNAELSSAVGSVTLANGAHGGAAATITAKSIAVTNSDAGGIAVNLSGEGTGNSHALRLNSTSGSAISATAGSHAINVNSSAGNGLVVAGATGDIVADITGTIAVCTTNTDLVTAAAIKTAMEATGSDLDYLIKSMVNKLVIKEADPGGGDAEMFDDSNSTLGTVSGAFTTVAGYTMRLRMVK